MKTETLLANCIELSCWRTRFIVFVESWRYAMLSSPDGFSFLGSEYEVPQVYHKSELLHLTCLLVRRE